MKKRLKNCWKWC